VITTLAIKNYALIEDLRVEMNEGLTVITGETGAGKSIILGALSLLLGKRADIGSVKDASKKCVVEGYFSIETYGLQLVFEENDLDYDPQTIIRREILPNGKSRAFVNDTPVALSQLQAIAPLLVDIHSQNETLEIVSENFQMEVIDALAGNSKTLKTYQAQLADFQKNKEKLEILKSQKASDAKELEYNTFLYNELKQAELQGMNQEELEETYETLNNAEDIQSVFSQVEQLLNEEQIGTVETAKEARIAIGRIKGFSGIYEDYWNRFQNSAGQMRLPFEWELGSFSEQLEDLIQQNQVEDGYCRLLLTGGYSSNGFYPDHSPNFIVTTQGAIHYPPSSFDKGIKLLSIEYTREYPTIKSINYTTVLLARDRLREEEAEDVLYYSHESVTESSRSNFFIIDRNGVLKTPGRDILAGITRSKVLEVAKEIMDVEIADIPLDEVRNAQSAFITSTTKGIMPVTHIDSFAINDGVIDPAVGKLQQLLLTKEKQYIRDKTNVHSKP